MAPYGPEDTLISSPHSISLPATDGKMPAGAAPEIAAPPVSTRDSPQNLPMRQVCPIAYCSVYLGRYTLGIHAPQKESAMAMVIRRGKPLCVSLDNDAMSLLRA